MEIRTTTLTSLKGAFGAFQQDIEAIPEDAISRSFGPQTRTVADIVYEVNMVTDDIGMVLRGETPEPWPEGGWVRAPADFNTKQVVLDAFIRSSQRFLAMAEAYSEADFERTVQTEHGERSRFQRCQFVALHIWYHSGQLNYIQTLLGDDAMHWG